MRTLDKIKYDYLESFTYNNPTKEEIDYYKITDDLLKKWRTQERLNYKIKFFNMLTEFNNCDNQNKEKRYMIVSVYNYFFECTNDRDTEDAYYYEIFPIFKVMYENGIFDLLTYNEKWGPYLAKLKGPLPPMCIPVPLYIDRKYAGIIPNLYYSNHLDVFDEVLKYFANVIYQKYGLYLQQVMNTIIEFCKEYNLPYVQLLNKAKEDAKKLDYPSNHEFKYQFKPRLDVKWED